MYCYRPQKSDWMRAGWPRLNSHHCVRTDPTQYHIQRAGTSSTVVKRLKRAAYRSPPSSVKVKLRMGGALTSPLYVVMACDSIKHKYNFTFSLYKSILVMLITLQV